jgi:hypothetical protein
MLIGGLMAFKEINNENFNAYYFDIYNRLHWRAA